MMLFAGDPRTSPELFAGSPVNTDDRPVIEFLAPRLTRMGATGDKDWFTGEPLAEFYERLAAGVTRSQNPLAPQGESAEVRRGAIALFRYALATARHDAPSAAAYEAEVRTLVPDVIAAAEASRPSLANAEHDLAGLRDEQEDVRRRLEAMERRLGELSQPGESRR
jgi:hypothetical protein